MSQDHSTSPGRTHALELALQAKRDREAMVRAWVTRDGMDLRPCLLRRRVGRRRHGALLEDHEGGTGKKSFHQGWTCGRDRSPAGRVASDRPERNWIVD